MTDDGAATNNETKDDGKGKGTRLQRTMGLWTGISIIIGNIIGPHRGDDTQQNYWVTSGGSGGHCILVSKQQLMPTPSNGPASVV